MGRPRDQDRTGLTGDDLQLRRRAFARAAEVLRPGRGLSFYVAKDGGYAATELTRGPWDPAFQHGGPPCALLGRELDRAGQVRGRVARITFEIVRPVPIGALEVSARVRRPGRRVELVEGALSADGDEVILARAWRIRTEPLALEGGGRGEEPASAPAAAVPQDFFPTGQETGHHTAMEVRFEHGSYIEPGPARAWLRMKVPLVEGEEVTPLDRLLVACDSGNGVSAPLDYRQWIFINTDLSVAVRRPPEGEWVCLDSRTDVEPSGIGLTDTTLLDERGPVGRATQSLLVAGR